MNDIEINEIKEFINIKIIIKIAVYYATFTKTLFIG